MKDFLFAHPFRAGLVVLLSASLALRAFLAAVLELGNDEVYYWTYALYPDLSHFDHPPMVGWMIQLFTFDLALQDEFFLRLPGLVLGTLNTLLVYRIGTILKDERTGWYAALLFTASIYGLIIAGTFILPDTPQLFFWLLSLYLLIPALSSNPAGQAARMKMLMAGVAVGLAMLSKYTSVFLWFGALLFILLRNRSWLKSASLYISLMISTLIFSPVLIWNFQNDFVSFAFQGSRAGFFVGGLRVDYFLTELGGEALYNNPVVYVLVLLALAALVMKRQLLADRRAQEMLLLWSLPLVALFLFLSLFRPTLPHWTGPAFITLIFPAAGYVRAGRRGRESNGPMPAWPAAALALAVAIALLGVLQINHGILYTGRESEITRRGEYDVSLDMFGWKQVGEQFSRISAEDVAGGRMPADAPILSHRWFPAANLDYYAARPSGRNLLAAGTLESIHKYYWINQQRPPLKPGMDAYFITTSRDYKDPSGLFADSFVEIEAPYSFPILRGGKVAGYGFIFRLKGFK